MCAIRYTFCQQSKRKLYSVSYKNGYFVCRKHANKPSTAVLFDSTVEKQNRDELKHQPSSFTSRREARGIHHLQSACESRRGNLPPCSYEETWLPRLSGQQERGCSSWRDTEVLRSSPPRPPRGKKASGLQRELQRCPASQRNKCLHYFLVNNWTCLGFVFKLARTTRFSKSLATTLITMLFGCFKIFSLYFYISIPTDCMKAMITNTEHNGS